MQPLWDSLGQLTMPVAVIAGGRDSAYRDVGRRMVARLPHARLVVLVGGHALPLENPRALAEALEGLDAQSGG